MIPNVNSIIYDGVDLERFGVVPTAINVNEAPVRNFTVKSVPGRNGDIVIDEGNFKNIDITYSCYVNGNFSNNFGALKTFLLSKKGYCRLEDTYEPDYFREGYYSASIEPEMAVGYDAGKFNLTFTCKPQRFLRSGEQPLIFEAEESEQGFVLPGYEEKSWLRSEISSDNSNIYKKALYYALNEDFPGTQQVRGIYFVLPADTVGNYTIQLSGEQECPKFGVSSWYIEGGGEYSMYGNMSAYGNKATYRKNATSHDLLICIGSIPERADTVFVDGEIVFSAGVYFSRSFKNPTDFDALPLIKLSGVTAAGSGRLLDIGGQSVTITEDDWDEVYIDCDGMFIYSYVDGEIVNLAPYVGFLDELVIKPGKNDLIAKPGIIVEITPRWWSV